jgi:predicted nucleotide-binding protein (sugar kinase/HSP70/actin superfamily)
VVVDFTMNDACAAGTGSFLEERAEELDIAIKGEFAELALSSEAPIRLGERCTVFMERDVNSYMQRGAAKSDLVAGLAYSVVYNYINRVVRGRTIGDCIFFQGGTAYNDSVAAAFSMVTGKQIIVPPHNGMMGSIGAALLAQEHMESGMSDNGTRFRGYDMGRVNYGLREFECKGCSNTCQIQEFEVEGEKTYWGDKCSDRFRKRQKCDRPAVIDDLMEFRRKKLTDKSHLPGVEGNAPLVGIPLAMFAWDQLPFWRTLLAHMGFRTVLSEPTNKKIIDSGMETVVAEPCFPIIVAHGHVVNLMEKETDYILLPNILSLETRWTHTECHLCPWNQTLPFVVRRAPAFEQYRDRFLSPLVPFREGRGVVRRQIKDYFMASEAGAAVSLNRRKINRAITAAFEAQESFKRAIEGKGAAAMQKLQESGEPGIVLLGRPYNVHDVGMNLSVARKLRNYYGVNCIPLDFLDTDDVDVRDHNSNMYWGLGRNILAAAKIVGENPNLHIIYITNFKCGPDSFIKHFICSISGKPFLTLQFDGHSNDAGMMTRCEAYLDSKGILRAGIRKTAEVAE